MIDSVYKTGKNYYPQAILEECKYVVKEKKMPEYITDDIEISSDSDREDSDEENSDDENLVKNSFYDFFFLYIIMVNKYYQKHKKDSDKKHAEDIKILLKKK